MQLQIGGLFIITYLSLYGFDPDDFEEIEPAFIKVDDGFVVELTQKKASYCPLCGSTKIYINDHRLRPINIRHSPTELIHFHVYMTRCKCRDCHASFTNPLTGIEKGDKFAAFTKQKVLSECKTLKTFQRIAKDNNMSKMRVIQIFDDYYVQVDPLPLPKVMCIDEIKFFTDIQTKYITVITNFETGEIVDIVESRKYDVLKSYFSSRIEQTKNVKIFISDMGESYKKVQMHFFSHATHIIDLFHVIKDLTNAVNKIRTEVMKKQLDKSGEKAFMKTHWRLFLARFNTIPYKLICKRYHNQDSNREMDYESWIRACLYLDDRFYRAYKCLQEMYEYTRYSTYEEGKNHIKRIISLLRIDLNDELLNKVADTYEENLVGIVNCLDKKSNNFRYTTGIAENVNNHIKTIIKMSYGCLNYERFRKRVLIISRHNKMNRVPGYEPKWQRRHI